MSKMQPTSNALKRLPRRLRRILAQTGDPQALLKDKKYDAFLYDKYKYYNEPGLMPVRDSLFNAWSLINAMVNSQEFVQGTGLYSVSPYAKGAADNRSPAYKHCISAMADSNNFLGVYENSVEIRFDLPDIPFSLGFGFGMNRDANAVQDENRKKAENIIQTFIPAFSLPTAWKRNDGQATNYGVAYAEAVMSSEELKSEKRMPLEFLSKLNMPWTPPTDWRGLKKFEFAPNYVGNFDRQVTLEFEIEAHTPRVTGSTVSLARGAGPLTNMGAKVEFTMKMRAFVRYPIEYALWSTCCTAKEQFLPKLFFDFAQRQISFAFRQTGGRKPPERISSISAVRDRNKDQQQKQNFYPHSRTNKEGYTILDSGEIVWIPTVDNVSEYMQAVGNSYDPVANRIKMPAEINKTIPKGIRNRPIYTDWLNNRFSYTNESGDLKMMSLDGSIPLDNITIYRLLDMHIAADADFLMWEPKRFFSILNNIVTAHPYLLPKEIRERGPNFTSVENIYDVLANSGSDIRFFELAGTPLDRSDSRLQPYVDALRAVIKNAHGKLGEIQGAKRDDDFKITFTMMAQYFRLGLDLVNTYGKEPDKYRRTYGNAINANSVDNFSIDDVDKAGDEGRFDIPNLPGLTRFSPHQAITTAGLARCPKFAILNISAGGGKAPLTLVDILMLKAAGKINRPIVFMPKSLVKQYCDEINKFSKGMLNAFPLTLETIRRLKEVFGMTSDQIVEYLRSLPPNTIFVSDYNLLRNTTDVDTGSRVKPVVYGMEEIQPYPIVDILRRVEFDYAMADESQNVKNKDAQRTKALNALAAEIPVRRLASGTIVSNTPVDIVGQVGMINPSIFLNANNFALQYGKVFESGGRRKSKTPKVLSWNGELMGVAIKREIRPYAQYHTRTRQDWAFLLPKVIENFFEVRPGFTKKQKDYYDQLMSEAYEKIQGDIQLMKHMKGGAPEDEDAIESKLSRYFAKVEIFVNACYEDPHYRETVDADDIKNQVSPKVATVDTIIDAHFNGGKVGSVVFTPDKNKIIIFGYNVAVSKHFFKYSKYRDRMIHYEAGDDEALAKFQDPDSRYTILVANEDSIKEGFNLQIASHIIRLQTLWSPGPLEQAWSRVLRPDFERKYNREEIRLSWVIMPDTVEIAKTARLISKIIDKAKIDYSNKLPDTIRDADLEVLKMSLDLIDKYKDFDDIAYDKGSNYLETYHLYKKWMNNELDKSVNDLIEREKRKTGRTDITREDLQDLVMIPVTSTKTLPGSKQVYTPRVAGQKTFVTTTGVTVTPSSLVEEDEEGNTVSEKEIRPLEFGMLVDTEFGPGTIVKVLEGHAWVKVNIFKHPIKLPKSIIGVPTTRKGMKKLRRLVANDIGTSLTPKGMPMVSDGVQQEQTDYTLDDDEKIGDFKDQPEELDIRATIINGIPSLWTATKDVDVGVLARKMNWHVVAPFMAAQIKNYNGINAFIAYVEKAGITLSAGNKSLLLSLGEVMKDNKSQLLHVQTENIGQKWRDFFSSSHRRPADKKQLRVYPFIWEGKVYLAFTPSVHDARVVSKMKTMPPANGLAKFKDYNYNTIMFPYGNLRRALKEVREIERSVKIKNRDTLLNDLKSIHF